MKFCHTVVYCLTRSDSVGVISIRDRICSFAYACQPPAVLPGEGEAVTVGKGISDLIIGDGLAVKGKEVVSNPKTS